MKTTFLLKNLYEIYLFKNRKGSKDILSTIDKFRWLGGMEAYLIEVGKLPEGHLKFDLTLIHKKFLFIPYTTKESYEEYILRKVNEFLIENMLRM